MAGAVPVQTSSLCRGAGWPVLPLHRPSILQTSCSSPFPSIRCFSSKGRSRYLTERTPGWQRRYVVSAAESSNARSKLQSSVKWLLQPIGDGDSRHIGYKVPMPDSFEIVSDLVTVGRLPEKATMVIPVATVSGIHARLERKNGLLLVTDLGSTNGTFINEMQLKPGRTASAPPGSRITFGDTNLAMFLVSKLEESSSEPESSLSEGEVITEASQTVL